MRVSRLLIVSLLVAVGPLSLGACGGGDSDGSAPETTKATTTAPPAERSTTTEATGSTTSSASRPSGGAGSEAFCDRARQATATISSLLEATTATRTGDDDDDILAEAKTFFGEVASSLQEMSDTAPPEIEADVAYLERLFAEANTKAQEAPSLDEFDTIAAGAFGMTSDEYVEHNDALVAYLKDGCGIGADSDTSSTTAPG